jgi:hypothetical protein
MLEDTLMADAFKKLSIDTYVFYKSFIPSLVSEVFKEIMNYYALPHDNEIVKSFGELAYEGLSEMIKKIQSFDSLKLKETSSQYYLKFVSFMPKNFNLDKISYEYVTDLRIKKLGEKKVLTIFEKNIVDYISEVIDEDVKELYALAKQDKKPLTNNQIRNISLSLLKTLEVYKKMKKK